MSDEPNLDEPGKPGKIVIDGVEHDHEQTKFQNCQQLMGEVGDRDPTAEELEGRGLSRREYEAFLQRLLDDEDDLRDRRAATIAGSERTSGKNLELPAVEKDRLGLTHLKEETEPGIEDA